MAFISKHVIWYVGIMFRYRNIRPPTNIYETPNVLILECKRHLGYTDRARRIFPIINKDNFTQTILLERSRLKQNYAWGR